MSMEWKAGEIESPQLDQINLTGDAKKVTPSEWDAGVK